MEALSVGRFSGGSRFLHAPASPSPCPALPRKLSGVRKPVTVEAKKCTNTNKNRVDNHSFVVKPDEAMGPFPEAVLLREKKAQEDGKLLPEFADEEEAKRYEHLQLQLESDLNVKLMRHYEVVYLIHENHVDEVESIKEKIQDFLRKSKGKIWRMNDWGLRRLAYKIKKARNAHYILMNFELKSKYINDFKSLLDKDERIIRYLVINRDKAITENCPPPLEFHTLRAGMDGEENDDLDYDDDEFDEEDLNGEGEIDLDDYGAADDGGDDTISAEAADNNDLENRNDTSFSMNSGSKERRTDKST